MLILLNFFNCQENRMVKFLRIFSSFMTVGPGQGFALSDSDARAPYCRYAHNIMFRVTDRSVIKKR